MPATRLCAMAGVGLRTYSYMANGRAARPATLARLQTALNRYRLGFGGEAVALAPHAAFKACVVLAAFHLSADAHAALNADPGRRATANAEWMQAADVRRLGLYIANQFLGFRISDLSRAAGMTKQAVSAAMREMEWERDIEGGNNRTLDTLLTELERILL